MTSEDLEISYLNYISLNEQIKKKDWAIVFAYLFFNKWFCAELQREVTAEDLEIQYLNYLTWCNLRVKAEKAFQAHQEPIGVRGLLFIF